MDDRQNKFLLALRQITQEVSSERDLIKSMALLVKHIRQTTEADCSSLYLVDDLRRRYTLFASDGLSQQAVGNASLKFGEGLVGVVGSTREVLNLADAPSHPEFKYLPDVGEDEYFSFLGVPLLDQGELLGVLVVQSCQKKVFGPQEESFMVTLAVQFSSLIARRKQESSVEDDVLKRVHGTASTGNIAIARAVVWQPEVSLEAVRIQHCEDAELQLELFHQAMFQLQIEMDRTALRMEEDDRDSSGYLSGYGRLLDDPSFQDDVDNCITTGNYLATSAVKMIIEKRLQVAQQQGEKERCVDIRDFAQVLVSRLVHATNREFDFAEPVILVMENMPAAMIVELPSDKIAGFVATSANASAHASVLARDLNIPSVLGAPLNLNEVDGHIMIVDGKNSEIIIDPPEGVISEFCELVSQTQEQFDIFSREPCTPVVCLDGKRIQVCLNAGLNQKDDAEITKQTDGIGLYRTEIAFMLCSSFPTEQQQYGWYSKLLQRFAGKPVCMRTLDVGSDKALTYLPLTEANPALGWRGVRVSLDMPNLLHTQLTAMLRAHQEYGNLEIMIPMVSRLDEIIYVKQAIREVAQEIEAQTGKPVPLPRFGVMIEVPAMRYLMDEVAREVDFFAIGSNDLTQYLLAVDRSNPKVSRFFDSFHPAVVRCLYHLVTKAHSLDRRIEVCGELAGDPVGALMLLSLGYTSLSMNYSELLQVKYVLRRVSFETLQELGKKALTLTNSNEIRALYEDYAREQSLGRIIDLSHQDQLLTARTIEDL